MPRRTRRTATHPVVDKENPSTSKKLRHRLSTTELARLEDVFRQDTHPSRQQKKDLATQLEMDYKTITIWFQNKRQMTKRNGQRSERGSVDRPRADSCLRAVSSPSQNATLDATARALAIKDTRTSIVSRINLKPLIDSLNAMTSRARDFAVEAKDEAPDADGTHTLSVSAEPNGRDPTPSPGEHEQTGTNVKPVKWKRTLEWACKRHAKRRKLSREGYVRLGSAGSADAHSDSNDPHMDSALSLLSFASSAQVGPPKDVMRGASLLISFKHSWRRK